MAFVARREKEKEIVVLLTRSSQQSGTRRVDIEESAKRKGRGN